MDNFSHLYFDEQEKSRGLEKENADLRALLEECLPYIESEIRYCDFQRDWDGCNKAKKLKAKLAAKLEEEK